MSNSEYITIDSYKINEGQMPANRKREREKEQTQLKVKDINYNQISNKRYMVKLDSLQNLTPKG